MGAGERSLEYGAGIHCSHLDCVSNKNQEYSHSVVFAVLGVIVVFGNGWLITCHRAILWIRWPTLADSSNEGMQSQACLGLCR
jgi:hypothetical protein